MNPRSAFATFSLSLLLAAGGQAQDAAPAAPAAPAGFKSIFKGYLTGWQGDNPQVTVKLQPSFRKTAIEGMQEEFKAHWKVENGELVHDGQVPIASTLETFRDIELVTEFQAAAQDAGGIYLKGAPLVLLGNAETGSGALVNNTAGTPGQTPLVKADKPYGEWNQLRILQLGSRTTVEVNGQKVVDHAIMENFWYKNRQIPLPPAGPIMLQSTTGGLRWKEIQVRAVPAEEANSVLRGDDASGGFTPLFDGKGFEGWAGAVADYEVVDGAFQVKKGKTGTLHTALALTDFAVRMEFKLPPGANSGVVLRYAGEGIPSVNSLCEVQVVDDTHVRNMHLEPSQKNGSALKLVAGFTGYLRPAGEWNYQEITAQGNHVKVELNGTVVLDSDLPMRKKFESGFLGIVGQLDPVAYRNVAIKNFPKKQSGVADFR